MRVDKGRVRLPSWLSSAWARTARSREISDAGLLNGLTGDARKARRALLLRLSNTGLSTPELVQAAQAGRLGHLLLKDALTAGGTRYTLEEISDRSRLPVSEVARWFRAMGRGVSSTTSADFSREDLRLAQVLVEYRQLGLDEEGIFASARILGRNLWAIADAVESVVDERLSAEVDHPEVALRLATEVSRLVEIQASILAYVLANRFELLVFPDNDTTDSATTGDIAVCFADMVGFTSLGEAATPTELAQLAERLDRVTTDAVQPPVRFVKTVGDAVMLISPDPNALARTVLKIFAAARTEKLPSLHAGIAWGPALPSAGDWIGRTVNLASRISAVAKTDVILVDEAMRNRLDGAELRCESAGVFNLKGYGEGRELFRLQTATAAIN
ncbi:adenylate/guanylate cyclase domain-containing protein [Antrihabitans stalactiti]|uniref:Adenylate/guanylate cyclase domain-containing protein n=1 Tax=Antrihabitans stalactiti TaxID=2584121 RepID=A0A848K5L8_9NOCA|nr:adenylate/guanylate cyclase domain-containing protein [Antrihabitans stalactiti]NMN93871.1 adenylate/guanylate cyclase domain-containing protein [Antrihabitans stalactiti]